MESRTFEFEVEVRVRKLLHFSGPSTIEHAEQILRVSLESGVNPNIFAKRGKDGHPVEQIVGNDMTITAVPPDAVFT